MTTTDGQLVERRILAVLHRLATDEPVVAIHGPRSVGKSTVLAQFADARGVPVIDFDDAEIREAATRNPNLVANGDKPVCIDEYQRAPQILDALKARLSKEHATPGTAVLTGSTRHDALPRTAQALTGRLHALALLPLSQGELTGTFENFIPGLLADPAAAVAAHPSSTTTRDEYIMIVTRGGFPLAVRRTGTAQQRWFDDYIRQSIERDVIELSRVRERQVLRTVLERLAAQTAQLLNIAKLGAGIGANIKTVESHVRLLEDLFLVQRLDAWGTTLRARAQRQPKIHVVDSGLAARLLRLSPAKLARLDPTALTEFGKLLETFVVGELRKQVSWMDKAVTVGHWRTGDDQEVDFVIETDDGRVIGFEVKANQTVPGTDLKGLRVLRDALGDRFVAGVALSTGTRSYTYEDRIHVCPVDRLWQTI